jgi:hypothetical protein
MTKMGIALQKSLPVQKSKNNESTNMYFMKGGQILLYLFLESLEYLQTYVCTNRMTHLHLNEELELSCTFYKRKPCTEVYKDTHIST